MVTQPIGNAPTTIDLTPYFNVHLPNLPQHHQQPSFMSRLWSGTQHYLYASARQASEEAAQGLANRISDLFANNQEEITHHIRDVFTQALLRRCPENLHHLLTRIQTFLNNPSQDDLYQINQLLNAIDPAQIRAIAPRISDQGIQQLITLSELLRTEIIEQPSIIVGDPQVLTISDIARGRLQIAKAVLHFIIENHEGVLIQILNQLTQSMVGNTGLIHRLREQLNHPQDGIIAEGLATLRHNLNASVYPPLRQSKHVLEAYRNALGRNASSEELLPLIRTLHDALQQLLARRDLVSQIILNQWVEIEQWDRQLQNILSSPESLPPQLQQLAQSDTPHQIITSAFNAQRGIIEEASDILVDGIGRGVMHLVTLPNRMYQHFYSPQSSAPVPQAPTIPAVGAAESPPAAALANNFLNLNDIAAQGKRFLDSILASAGGALSQQGTKALATLVRYTFEKIRDHIQQTPEQQHLLRTIDPMILRLQDAINNASWAELTGVLQSAFQFMQEQQVYLQGLRLPLNPVRTHVSAIPDFLQNIDAHQNALQPPSQRTLDTISDADLLQKAKLFKSRASSFGPAKLVLEKICGMECNDVVYANIYDASGLSEKNAPSMFRQRLFKTIDRAHLGFFSAMIKWSAKRIYDLVVHFSSFYVNSTVDNIFNLVQETVKHQASSAESKEEYFVDLARNWLAVTSATYNQVAAAPASQTRDLKLMMEKAIKSPEHNGGLTQKELYAALAKTAIDHFGPQIKWDKTIDHYFNTQIPESSPLHFLNPLLNGLNHFCSFCLKTVLFVPKWVGNLMLQSGAKIALNHFPLLKNYSKQTIDLFRGNTPLSYATQQLLYRQLQKILQLLQQRLNDDESESGLHTRNTNLKRVEIAGLVEYLMEVLNKSQYPTQDRLNNYLQHRAPLRNRLGRELDDSFVPEVMEDIVMIFSLTLKTITQESEMRQTLYDALCIANDAFEIKAPVSHEDFVTIESGIKELTDQILEATIFHAIDEKFDFTNEKQKRGIAHFMQTMKEQSQAFAAHMHPMVQEISNQAIPASTLVSKISSMIEYSSQYHHDRVDALGKADGNRNFHTETKYHLNELSRTLLSHCTPLAQQLNNMKNIADELTSYEKWLTPLLFSIPASHTLGSTLQNQRLSSQDLTSCHTQLALLHRCLTTLQSHQCPLPVTNDIQRHYQACTSALQHIEGLQKEEIILRTVFPLFNQLKQEKINTSTQPPSHALKQLERQLCDLLNTLSNTHQKNQLVQQVLTLMLAQGPESVEAAASSFLTLYFQFNIRNSAEENAQLSLLGQTNDALHSRLNSALREFSHQITTDKSAIQHLCSEMRNLVNELDRWVQAQHDLPIWNLFIFDMQWVTETVKNLAFDRAQSKIKQLFDSFYQRHFYFGFTNQVLLLPFLEKFGKHHLKTKVRAPSAR